MKDIRISVVIPIFNEQEAISELYQRCVRTLSGRGNFELIFVDDGSVDGSYTRVVALSRQDKRVKVLHFSRNFGHQIALSAGIDHAVGEAVITIDGDLQDPPEVMGELINAWEQGAEIVFARRKARKDSLFKKCTAFIFYRLLQKFSSVQLPVDVGDFRLLDKKVVSHLRQFQERQRYVRGLVSWVGFSSKIILYEREERKNGVSKYHLSKMMRFAWDGITSFSYIPLRAASYLGILSALIGFLLGLYTIYAKLTYPAPQIVVGWASIITAIFFLGGVQLLILGVMGEYIGRIYTETLHRPLYIIEEKINFEEKPRTE
jgi:dolichol-phosphate mannosyltransferase